jgi:cytochrome c-type biogenesis protein CcmE
MDLSPVEVTQPKSSSGRRSLLVIAVLVIAVIALLSQGLLQNLNYFETVDQALAQKHSLGTKTLRLEGVVKKGTIVRTNSGTDFTMAGSDAATVSARVTGTPPQLFQANIPVVVVGHFASARSDVFLGSQIMVKHSANYIAAHPQRVKAPNGSVR